MTVQTLTIRRPDDWHLHLRDDELLRAVLPVSARQFGRAVVMPNLKPPVTTVEAAMAYRERILGALPPGSAFTPLMTCYLCDTTDPADIRAGFDAGAFAAAKLYPAGATTHSEYGVTSIDRITGVLSAMQDIGMPLLIHGESTDPAVDVFDRETAFLHATLQPLLARYPRLKVVLEHITTAEAADFVMRDSSGRLAATITPQHLMFNRNAIFAGGIRPHYYCLPVLKRERHRLALRRAATSGLPAFFLGTDSAPHDTTAKESACGCAGIFSAHVALQAYLTVFEEEDALGRFEAFASDNGARFYGIPPNRETITFHRRPMRVTEQIDLPDGRHIRQFLAGETLPWTLA
ncbi:dihydro-orotase [Cupriavidus taiwanensis]|uniref:Dihydroorotase n=1 Tax=Cupriavidus taiwanensis TaxID=164546 RepID=A0A375I7S2_9BURK|nr:dihydroorotase [Cupriavidus taiwanensis]SPK70687.1 dihydro-orotase [Cupriavidus taiwanensis]SPK72166.1 dihydro-orotase [Cupriavidus taiwanensis]